MTNLLPRTLRVLRSTTALTSILLFTSLPAMADPPNHFPHATPLNLPNSFAPNTLPPSPLSRSDLKSHWNNIPNLHQITPHLKVNKGVYHSPLLPSPLLPSATAVENSGEAAGSVTYINSSNWSGSGVVGSPNQYATGAIAFATTIPRSVAPLNTSCSTDNTFRSTATWAGFDGLGNSTVEQGGIWLTQQGCQQPQIGVFIETYPDPEITITNFPVSTGDLVIVWLFLDQPNQSVCITYQNETAGNVTAACLKSPVSFTASTFEWVVERPSYGQLVPLSNYLAWPIWSGNAWDYHANNMWTSAAYDWGSSGQFYSISMLDNSGGRISYPTTKLYDTVIMHVDGSAYCVPSTSCHIGW